MNRIELITDRLKAHAMDMTVNAVPMTREQWATVEDDGTGTTRFGYIAPTELPLRPELEDGGEPYEFRFCPEIVAEQTESLTDEDLTIYLDAVETQVSLLVVHEELPPLERRQKVEDKIWELGPGSLMVLTDVQMAVLDRTDS